MNSALLVAAGSTGADPDLTRFGTDPFWLVLIKGVAVFAFLMIMTLFGIVFERKVVARMQVRLGPNRHGPKGWGQSLLDGIKLMLKEDIIPALADKPVFLLAPLVSVIPALIAFAVIPFGPEVSIFGHHTVLQLADLPVGVLYLLSAASIGVYGLILSGWSSGSTYPLLGSLRSAAQIISYEIAMGLAFVAVFMYSGTLSTSGIVEHQRHMWYIALFPSFVIYMISMVGETNRTPFDLPEAEGELVGGFLTEYSSIKFAFFYLAEYVNLVTVSAVMTTLFLGGWQPPPIPGLSSLDHGWVPLIWFMIKLLLVMFFFVWLRGTLPRLRYDQFMSFGWKILIPAGLIWVLLIAALRTIRESNTSDARPWLIGLAVILGLFVVAEFLFGGRSSSNDDDLDEEGPPGLENIPWPPSPGSRRDAVDIETGAARNPAVIPAGPRQREES
ncbi:NADH-quinone oxidoreductase subunit NuoH [Pseudofrankia sp. DC12]|uniref:NADH-quinone oxidoreductase subunit NuoH n=1 Tax=Pseudofrankia sp. DC12 TaxID=683315 RepID=UPI0005F7BB21|nr:NADH-quinone oxidoreductase subunit NuoH [Pseudofrankia sp. DC12]